MRVSAWRAAAQRPSRRPRSGWARTTRSADVMRGSPSATRRCVRGWRRCCAAPRAPRSAGRLRVGELEIDAAARAGAAAGPPVVLSQKEFALVRMLAADPRGCGHQGGAAAHRSVQVLRIPMATVDFTDATDVALNRESSDRPTYGGRDTWGARSAQRPCGALVGRPGGRRGSAWRTTTVARRRPVADHGTAADATKGAELAVKYINAELGGIGGHPPTLPYLRGRRTYG